VSRIAVNYRWSITRDRGRWVARLQPPERKTVALGPFDHEIFAINAVMAAGVRDFYLYENSPCDEYEAVFQRDETI